MIILEMNEYQVKYCWGGGGMGGGNPILFFSCS